LKVLEQEDDTKHDNWNTESTLKWKKVVVSRHQQFKWQSTGADAALTENPLTEWLAPRILALRPLYWKISCDAYTGFKTRYKGQHGKACFKVRRCEN